MNKIILYESEAATIENFPAADLRDYLPVFSDKHAPLVFIENTRFDAKQFKYNQPYVILGKMGFLVDYGYRWAYFSSTWQGRPNPSLRFQDLQLLKHSAENRTCNEENYPAGQLGLWACCWYIGGTDPQLVGQLKKLCGIVE